MTAKRKAARRYPPIPTLVQAPGGPVTVSLARHLRDDGGTAASGHYANRDRHITIDTDEPRSFQWLVYFHELTHVALLDSGLAQSMGEDLQEVLCDAIATARFRERFG